MTVPNSNTLPDSTHRPWQIVLLLPNAQHRLTAQFRNRSDAEHHLRSLRKLAPDSPFNVSQIANLAQHQVPTYSAMKRLG
jgi:hypothetical protein